MTLQKGPEARNEHIIEYLEEQLGLARTSLFAARLYTCDDTFGYMPIADLLMLTKNLILPLTVFAAVLLANRALCNGLGGRTVPIKPLRRAENYIYALSLILVCLALLTKRLKFVYIPFGIITAFLVASKLENKIRFGKWLFLAGQIAAIVNHGLSSYETAKKGPAFGPKTWEQLQVQYKYLSKSSQSKQLNQLSGSGIH